MHQSGNLSKTLGTCYYVAAKRCEGSLVTMSGAFRDAAVYSKVVEVDRNCLTCEAYSLPDRCDVCEMAISLLDPLELYPLLLLEFPDIWKKSRGWDLDMSR